MLTILSDTQVRTLLDSIKTIQEILESSQTVNFDGPTAAVKAPTPVKKRESQSKTQSKTHGSKPRKYRALDMGQVIQIKTRLASGEGATAISRDYKVHLTTINAIKWGKTWKHVTLEPTAAKS
jgi:hypothetical protein